MMKRAEYHEESELKLQEMNYKGIQLPLTHCNPDNGNLTQELHTIESVSFDPCMVTFENGITIPWEHTREEFDIYIESIKLPTVQDYLIEVLKSKQILMNKKWWEVIEIGKFLVKIRSGEEEREYLMEDLFSYRIK